jgi:hypothetical protein
VHETVDPNAQGRTRHARRDEATLRELALGGGDTIEEVEETRHGSAPEEVAYGARERASTRR